MHPHRTCAATPIKREPNLAAMTACEVLAPRLRELASVLEAMGRGEWDDGDIDPLGGWRFSAGVAREFYAELRPLLHLIDAL